MIYLRPYIWRNWFLMTFFKGYDKPCQPYVCPAVFSASGFIWLTLLLTSVGSVAAGTQPIAQQGILDLRQYDLSKQDVELSGEWKWFWHQLRVPNQPQSAFEYTDFPKLWRSSSWKHKALPNQGYATYALTVLLPHQSVPLGLILPPQYTAYRLFINGKLWANDGTPATTPSATKPYWSTQLISLPTSVDTLHLLMQVANFEHAKGGPSKPIRLGPTDQLTSELTTKQALSLILTGCLFMSGLFFLGMLRFSRYDRSVLCFSLFCIFYSYRIIGTEDYILHTIIPDLPWGLTLRLEYLSLYLAVGVFVAHTQSLYPRDTHPRVTKVMEWLCFLFAGTVVLFPPSVFTRLMNPFLVLMVWYIGYASYIYWIAAKRRRPGANFSLMGTGLLLAVFVLIILQYFEIYEPPLFVLFAGYLGFFFLQSLVMFYRFAFALNEARRTERQFLTNMSHEIRTPLNAIIGFSNLLENTSLNSEQTEFVHYIHTAGKNLLTIVNDILDIAKIEAGMLPLESIPFSIASLVDSIKTMLLPAATDKNLRLDVVIDPALPSTLLGDPTRLTQILLNLISNAIKFTQQGSITVEVKNMELTADSARVRFTVQDTGIGMEANVLPHIFERFRQANGSTTRHYGGTGLGLSIVKSLTELQGGWVNVTSTPGAGSCFTFEITYPLAPSTPDQQAESGAKNWGADGRHLSILVVEDNPINQKLAMWVLSRLGYSAEIAENGQQAVDRLQQHDVDLVLMDIQMPIMDGYTATRHIRNILHKQIPIIAMTAHALPNEREQCLQAGMNDFLPKPFQPQDLQRLIRKYVLNSTSTDSFTASAPESMSLKQEAGFSIDPLLAAIDGDMELAIEVLESFLEQTPLQISQIGKALTNEDMTAVDKLLHTQKPSIQLLGFTKAFKQIRTAESLLAAQAPPSEVIPLVQQYILNLEAELSAIDSYLKVRIKNSLQS